MIKAIVAWTLWVQPAQWSEQVEPFYIGVSFLCPHCDHTDCPECGAHRGKRLAVRFWPPIDPGSWEPRVTPIPHVGFHTRVSGDTFEALTLSPSVGLDPHWHGHIVNGVLKP
jgi:hypothetical protein